jgi:hypothetical protein
MQHAKACLILLLLLGGLRGGTPAIASADDSPASAMNQQRSVLQQVASALAARDNDMQDLRGPPIENSNLDQLKLPVPGMDCGIARPLIFVVCHSVWMNNKKEAEDMFIRIIDDVKTVLPSDSWKPIETAAYTGLLRSVSYHDRKSGAKIDFDLLFDRTGEGQPLYCVRVFGWKGF